MGERFRTVGTGLLVSSLNNQARFQDSSCSWLLFLTRAEFRVCMIFVRFTEVSRELTSVFFFALALL